MSTHGMGLHDFVFGTSDPIVSYTDITWLLNSVVGFKIFQTARPWISQAGVARRLVVSPRKDLGVRPRKDLVKPRGSDRSTHNRIARLGSGWLTTPEHSLSSDKLLRRYVDG